jgi:hypothetical protein
VCVCAHERTRKKTLTKQQTRKRTREKKQYKLQTKWSSSTDRATDNERAEEKKRWYIYMFGASTRREREKKGKEKKAVPILPPSRE